MPGEHGVNRPEPGQLRASAVSCNRRGTAPRGERHHDERRPAEHEVDADEESQRPRGGPRQSGPDDGGNNEIDDAAQEDPTPASHQLAAVLDRQGKIREARQLVEKVPALHPGREEEARFRYNSTGGNGVAVSRSFFEENASSRMRVLADALARSAAAPAEAAKQGPRP